MVGKSNGVCFLRMSRLTVTSLEIVFLKFWGFSCATWMAAPNNRAFSGVVPLQWFRPARWRKYSIWVEEKKKSLKKTVRCWRRLARCERKY
jgi:hypothetical protein